MRPASPHKSWSPRKDAELARLWHALTPVADIAKALGKSVSSINNRRIRTGLAPRNYQSGETGEKVEENSVRVYLPLSYLRGLEAESVRTGRTKSSLVRDLIGEAYCRAQPTLE